MERKRMSTQMPSKIGLLEVNLDFLAQLIRLPDNAKFLKVRQSWEQEQSGRFEILIESPDLKDTHESLPIPWAKVILFNEFCLADEKIHIVRSEVGNW